LSNHSLLLPIDIWDRSKQNEKQNKRMTNVAASRHSIEHFEASPRQKKIAIKLKLAEVILLPNEWLVR
jgi:hypothetical protein